MDADTRRFVVGLGYGCCFGAVLWALLIGAALATGKPEPQRATASASQGQQQSQKQTATAAADQHQTATGGNATASQSQTANGGAANQTQSASNAGNQQVSNYDYARQTASAISPSIQPTTVCATGRSGAVQTQVFGVAGGTSGIDLQCEIRETARIFGELGYRETAALIACTSHAAVRAFNGRPCPVAPAAPADQSVTVRIEDVRAERAEARGFTAAGK